MVKEEMLAMLELDLGQTDIPLQRFADNELDAARALLATEIEHVKQVMGHDDLETAYPDTWEEVAEQVCRQGRASFSYFRPQYIVAPTCGTWR